MRASRMSNTSAFRPRGRHIAAAILITLVVAIGVCEALGWPFLAAPMQRWLGATLDRPVSFSEDPAAKPKVIIHLLGHIRVKAPYIEIGAPAWSKAPHMLLVRDGELTLGYLDLWRASRGEQLRIRELRAGVLDGDIERLADGRASWQFGNKTETPDTSAQPTKIPEFGRLEVDSGSLKFRDALTELNLDSTFSLVDRSAGAATRLPAAAEAAASAAGFHLEASGTYKKADVKAELNTSGVLPVIGDNAATVAVPVRLEAHAGGASITFVGTATDAIHLTALKGRFDVEGSSLAAVGDPLQVTLPTTGPFHAEGLIAKDGLVWKAVFNQVGIGSSRLNGAFTYDPRPKVPLLSGRLNGSRLTLVDLGPTVGAPVSNSTPGAPAPAASAEQPTGSKNGRVLPDRDFDLPSLRAMNANVLVDITDLDLNSSFLEPLKPLRTHLVLQDGVLSLRDIDARTGQGQLGGMLQLDGRNAQALWTANLHWAGVRLESWVHQTRADGAPPWATGNLTGQARLAGQGKSTATILGSLRGGIRMQLSNGTVSHLAIEGAGLDVAQALGMLVKGDDSLKVDCFVADLGADHGTLKPRLVVLDSSDSTMWINGSVSMSTEALDLRVVTSPKDFSPLALRSPVHLRGTFGDPHVSIEASKLAPKLGAAALLALLTPAAAILPLLDFGDKPDAQKGAQSCRALSQRIAAHPTLPAPAPAAASGSANKAKG